MKHTSAKRLGALPSYPLAAATYVRCELGRDDFVDALADVPPKPAAMEQILRINQGREKVRS